ncbi:MAG: TatD family hydrolase [Actinomycetes bacterium]
MTTRRWADSHVHLFSIEDGADPALERARAAGVDRFVCVGTDLETSRTCVALAEADHDVAAVVGLHPHEARHLAEQREGIEALVSHPAVVGVGEAGFDLFYEHSPHADQEDAFRWQVALAHAHDRTLVIHTRDAWPDTFRVLESEGVPPRTVLHCFTGGPAEAERALALGCHLSFSGIITFRNADDLRAAAALAPLDRVLVETDAPYLAPVPHRGRANEPAHVVHVGEALAAAMGRDVDEVAAATRATTRRLLGRG